MTNFTVFPSLTGSVSSWKKLWRTIQFPTLNILGESSIGSWTYMVRVYIDGQFYSGMAVWFSDKKLCEVHCFQMTWDSWYTKEVTVTFLKKIRENQTFESVDLLQKQLQLDKQYCLDHKISVLTFGSFDLLHPWHEAYLKHAKSHGDKLITIVASDESIQRFKKHTPTFSQAQRIKTLKELEIIDQIIPGNPQNFFEKLKYIQPNVLVFGYDQSTQDVENRYKEENLPVPFLVKAPGYQTEIYKSSLIKTNQEKNL